MIAGICYDKDNRKPEGGIMMDERLKQFAGFALALVMTTCMGIHFGEAAAMKNTTKKPVKVVQTAGRDALGDFAPDFARYNDDILFGEVWSAND